MTKNEQHVPVKEAIWLNWRAFKLLDHCCPGLFLSLGLYAVASAVTPYVPIYFSARLIDELAGLCRAEVLLKWVLLTLLSSALLTMITASLERWKEAKYDNPYYYRKNKIHGDKLASLDFEDFDKQTVKDQYNQVLANENWSGYGLPRIPWMFQGMIQSVVGIISAVALTVSLFTQHVPENAVQYVWMDHPVMVIVLLAVMTAIILLSPALQTKANSYDTVIAEGARLGNRIFSKFGFNSQDTKCTMDIRMYRQQKICGHYMSKPRTFMPGGVAARLSAGPIGLLFSASAALSAVMTGVIYVFVCLKAWAGAYGIGAVTQYVGSLTALTENLANLFATVGELRNNGFFLKGTFEFLDIPNAMYQGSLTTEKRSDRQYEVEFRNVSFKYPGSEIWALKNVNIKFKVGKRLAIVGENGSGKTTFIKLLCRLYDPQEGQILLNGIDIRKYRYDDYMNIFSIVFQDFQLISQPLGNNVAGSAAYDRERVMKALTDAGFADRLADMPDGLDTMLYKDFGENGVEVSGGEAQKIAIARALYKDAPFIILDEPTAALDPIAEAEIYSKFNDIVGDKTAIYISHRLSSCKFCDEIAVFHEGAVIQQGTHVELVADETGKYHALWNAQAQYYTENTV